MSVTLKLYSLFQAAPVLTLHAQQVELVYTAGAVVILAKKLGETAYIRIAEWDDKGAPQKWRMAPAVQPPRENPWFDRFEIINSSSVMPPPPVPEAAPEKVVAEAPVRDDTIHSENPDLIIGRSVYLPHNVNGEITRFLGKTQVAVKVPTTPGEIIYQAGRFRPFKADGDKIEVMPWDEYKKLRESKPPEPVGINFEEEIRQLKEDQRTERALQEEFAKAMSTARFREIEQIKAVKTKTDVVKEVAASNSLEVLVHDIVINYHIVARINPSPGVLKEIANLTEAEFLTHDIDFVWDSDPTKMLSFKELVALFPADPGELKAGDLVLVGDRGHAPYVCRGAIVDVARDATDWVVKLRTASGGTFGLMINVLHSDGRIARIKKGQPQPQEVVPPSPPESKIQVYTAIGPDGKGWYALHNINAADYLKTERFSHSGTADLDVAIKDLPLPPRPDKFEPGDWVAFAADGESGVVTANHLASTGHPDFVWVALKRKAPLQPSRRATLAQVAGSPYVLIHRPEQVDPKELEAL